ncbi:MAG TPA: dTDP-4-dehydrorhamnose reductase [Actinocrinis sp.]|nr:dTDP-4-dehydrorhamnose reductase [Actinocrinis sp.]
MRVLVTGAAGMLGTDLCIVLAETAGTEFTALDRGALDITDPDAAAAAVAGHDLVVNCAAWTNVDLAETEEEQATAINGTGPRNLAAACAGAGARFLQPSTDYVFPGDATAPIPEDTPTAPLNAYGRSKLAGEQAVLELLPETGYVVRTAWLYGAHGPNFVATMLRLAGERDTLDVVDDQVGQPTSTAALARQLVLLGRAALAGRAPAGVYHGTAAGQTSWHGLAAAAFELAGLDPARVRPTTSAAFVRPAKRPGYSVLAHGGWQRAGLEPMADWHEELTAAFKSGVF